MLTSREKRIIPIKVWKEFIRYERITKIKDRDEDKIRSIFGKYLVISLDEFDVKEKNQYRTWRRRMQRYKVPDYVKVCYLPTVCFKEINNTFEEVFGSEPIKTPEMYKMLWNFIKSSGNIRK